MRCLVRDSRWIPPLCGWIKCNFDASFRADREFTGIGWIVRDDNGAYLASGMVNTKGISSNLVVEASSFLVALQQMWFLRWRHIWFEGDCRQLAYLINKRQSDVEIGNLFSDILY